MIRRFLGSCTFAIALLLGATTSAPADTPAIPTLHTLFTQPKLDPALFTSNFVAKIPVTDVQAFVGSYVARLGAPTSIDKSGFEYQIVSPKGSIKVNIAFDQANHISSLLFHDELSAVNGAALQKVLAARTLSADWFEPSYLRDVPTQKLSSVLADMHAALGTFVRVDTRNSTYVAVFDHGESHAQISADIDGKINYLAFSKPDKPSPAP
jgi:hypothetical protein